MHIYKSSLIGTTEIISTSSELQFLSGKFLYFPKDILIIDESEELFHKDIYTIAKNSKLTTELPIGYGKIKNGEIVSWESHFFGPTQEEVKKIITDSLKSFC